MCQMQETAGLLNESLLMELSRASSLSSYKATHFTLQRSLDRLVLGYFATTVAGRWKIPVLVSNSPVPHDLSLQHDLSLTQVTNHVTHSVKIM